jgi:hypothetical protein
VSDETTGPPERRRVCVKSGPLVVGVQCALAALAYTALAVWLCGAPLLWIVRDGLGPDSVETRGRTAVAKFAPVLLVGLAIAGGLATLHRWASRTGS